MADDRKAIPWIHTKFILSSLKYEFGYEFDYVLKQDKVGFHTSRFHTEFILNSYFEFLAISIPLSCFPTVFDSPTVFQIFPAVFVDSSPLLWFPRCLCDSNPFSLNLL